MNYKKLLFAALAFLMITATISCKKDDEPYKDALSNTTWVGTLTPGNGPLALKFGEDAKVTVFVGGLNAPADKQMQGTYTLANENNTVIFTVTISINNNIQKNSFAGSLTNTNKIEGSWGVDNNIFNGGTFSVTKQ